MGQLNELTHRILVHKDNLKEGERWCQSQFGERWSVVGNRSGVWACFWNPRTRNNYDFYDFCFSDEKTAVVFALKFGS